MGLTNQELRKNINQGRKELGEIEKSLRESEELEKDREKNAYRIEERLNRIEQKLNALKGLEGMRQNLEDVRGFVEEKTKTLEEPKHKLKIYLGAELDRKFKEKGWIIEGNLPELRIEVMTLEFLLAQSLVKIWYGPKIELLGRTELEIDEVVKTVTALYNDLSESSFKDEDDFLKLLFDAYRTIIKKEGSGAGTAISIISWLGEIALLKQDRRFMADPRREYFKSYSRIQLSYDLFRLKSREYNSYEMRLIVASREQTKKKEDNLWVPGGGRGEGTHFASVCFRPHKEGTL